MMTSSRPNEGGGAATPRAQATDKIGLGLLLIALTGLLVPIAVAAYVGTFSRYLADDFCTLGSLREVGFLRSQAYWYVNWSGRFGFTFFVNLAEAAGAWIVPLLPGLWLLALVAGLARSFDLWLGRRLAHLGHLTSWALALLVVFETIAGAPNLYQSLYWQTGALTYVAPLALASLYAAWLLARLRDERAKASSLAVSAVSMGIAVGFSETVGSLIVAALAGTLVLVSALAPRSDRRDTAMRLVGAGVLGGVLGLVIVAAAPGNAVRMGLLTPSGDWVLFARETARNAYIFSVRALRINPARLLLTSVLPLLAVVAGAAKDPSPVGGDPPSTRSWLWLLVLPILTFVLVMACMAPSEYAMSSYPDGRVLIAAQFVIAVGMAVWGAQAGWTFSHFWHRPHSSAWRQAALGLSVATVVWIAVTGLQTGRALAAELPEARDFAARSDERLAKVVQSRSVGETTVAVASLSHIGGLDEISRDPNYWVNRCFAQAYALHRVSAK